MDISSDPSPGQSSVTVSSTTATTISLSWSVPSGSVVDSYEVMWERETSEECPDEDEGSATITDGSTSYTITGLEEDSSYTITVTATNAAESAVSDLVNAKTKTKGDFSSFLLSSPPTCYMCIYAAAVLSQCIACHHMSEVITNYHLQNVTLARAVTALQQLEVVWWEGLWEEFS